MVQKTHWEAPCQSTYDIMSELKINIEPTKAVWTGSLKDKTDGICQDLAITWESETFTLPGVTFSKNINRHDWQ